MSLRKTLEEDFYIAIVRSAFDAERIAAVRNRAQRNGLTPEEIEHAFNEAKERASDRGFVKEPPLPPISPPPLTPPPPLPESQPPQPPQFKMLGLFCKQGAIALYNARYNGQPVGLRSLERQPINRQQQQLWLSTEQTHAHKLSGSPRFLQAKGEYQDYVLTQPLQGALLANTIRENGKLTVQKAIAIADQILEALEEMHHQGLCYRYPDAARILLNGDKVILLDWGIPMTSSPNPFYMPPSISNYRPPEHPKTSGARGDIYAFGILLLLLLTGKAAEQAIQEIPTRHLQRVVRKCIQARPEDRFENCSTIRKALRQKRKKRIWPWFLLLFLVTTATAAGYYWAMEMQTESMYVVGTNVHLRSSPHDSDRLPDQRSYGEVIPVRSMEGEYAVFKDNGEIRYFPLEYLVNEECFREIDGIYGNPEARRQMVTSYQRLAIWGYFKENGMVGDLKTPPNPQALPREIWQFYGRLPEDKLQSFFCEPLYYKDDVKRQWMGIIISKKDSPQMHRRFLIFSFDENSKATLEFQQDLAPYPEYLFHLVRNGYQLKDFHWVYRKATSAKTPTIVFESPSSMHRYAIQVVDGQFKWVDPLHPISDVKGGNVSLPSYPEYKARFDVLKEDIRKYYLTTDLARKQRLRAEIPAFMNQYALIMDNSDRKFLENTLTKL